jgi:hypothetical protein
LFLSRSLSFDFYASTRPGNKQSRYLTAVEAVFDAFNDEALLQTLRGMEAALLSLKTFTTTSKPQSPSLGSKFTIGTPRMNTPRLQTPMTYMHTENLKHEFRNSGPQTRASIIFYESKFQYEPVFEEIELPTRVVTKFWETRERLQGFKHQKKPEKLSMVEEWLQNIFPAESKTPDDSITKNIDVLKNLTDLICDIFKIKNPCLFPIALPNLSDLDEENIKEWIPGVCSPERSSKFQNTLTQRGKTQVLAFN